MPIKGKRFKKKPFDEIISGRCPLGTRRRILKKNSNVSEFVRDTILKELKEK